MDHVPRKKVLPATGVNSWQLRAALSAGIYYLTFYFCKYNLGPATPGIQKEFHFSSETFGWVTTIFTLVYAAGQFINGFLGDRFGPKTIMIIGGIGGIIANVLFGSSSTLNFFILFWMINAYFSSTGWSTGCRIMFNWFPENRWGQWIGIYNGLCYFGAGIVVSFTGYVIAKMGWRGAFFIPPMFMLAMLIMFIFLGKNSPQDAGFEPEWEQKKPLTKKKVNAQDYLAALLHPKMNLAYLAGVGDNFVRWGLMSWMVKILYEPVKDGGFGMPIAIAGLTASLMHYGGAFFSVILGVITDRVFKGQRWQTVAAGFFIAAGALFVIAKGASIGILALGIALFLSGGLIQAVQTPLFALAGDIMGQERGATTVGIMDGWMYVGASLSGVFLGYILDTHGLLAGVSLMGGVSLVCGFVSILIRR